MKRILILLLIVFSLRADSILTIRNVTLGDIVYQPHSEEGYLQGWNFFFRNSEYNIIVTFLVSNLGPNDLNNGVSIAIESKKTGSIFITKEFGRKDFSVDNGIMRLNPRPLGFVDPNCTFRREEIYGDDGR